MRGGFFNLTARSLRSGPSGEDPGSARPEVRRTGTPVHKLFCVPCWSTHLNSILGILKRPYFGIRHLRKRRLGNVIWGGRYLENASFLGVSIRKSVIFGGVNWEMSPVSDLEHQVFAEWSLGRRSGIGEAGSSSPNWNISPYG